MVWPVLLAGSTISTFLSVVARFLIPYIVVKALWALSITTFTIIGSLWLVGYIETAVTAQFDSIGGSVGSILIMCGFLDAFAIIFNCWVIAINIRAMKGAFKGMKFI